MTIGKLSGQCDFGQKGQSYCNQRGQSCVAKRVKVAWLFQRTLKQKKMAKLVQYGERIWHIDQGTDEERADKAIQKTEEFFKSLGLPTRLGDAGIGEETILEIQKRFTQRQVAFGEDQDVTAEVAGQILENCK